MTAPSPPTLTRLPYKILLQIFEHLEPDDLQRFLSMSRQLRALAEDRLYREEIEPSISLIGSLSGAIDRKPRITKRISEFKWDAAGLITSRKYPVQLGATVRQVILRLKNIRLLHLEDHHTQFNNCVGKLDLSSHLKLQYLRLPAACFSGQLPPALVDLRICNYKGDYADLRQSLPRYLRSGPKSLKQLNIRGPELDLAFKMELVEASEDSVQLIHHEMSYPSVKRHRLCPKGEMDSHFPDKSQYIYWIPLDDESVDVFVKEDAVLGHKPCLSQDQVLGDLDPLVKRLGKSGAIQKLEWEYANAILDIQKSRDAHARGEIEEATLFWESLQNLLYDYVQSLRENAPLIQIRYKRIHLQTNPVDEALSRLEGTNQFIFPIYHEYGQVDMYCLSSHDEARVEKFFHCLPNTQVLGDNDPLVREMGKCAASELVFQNLRVFLAGIEEKKNVSYLKALAEHLEVYMNKLSEDIDRLKAAEWGQQAQKRKNRRIGFTRKILLVMALLTCLPVWDNPYGLF